MKIAIVGNSGGGKTILSRKLSEFYKIPVTHIDSIQFLPGMVVRPLDETRKILKEITLQENWLIDGFGPLDLLEERFLMADKIIFIDLPLWRHYWWCTKRQIKSFKVKRAELPEGCNEATLKHTVKLFQTLWRVHKKMKPELMKIFNKEKIKPKMIYIKNLEQWENLYNK